MCCVFGDISIAKKYIMKKTAESFCFVTLPSFCFRRLSAKLSSGSRRPEQPMPFAGAVLLRQRGQPVIAVEEILIQRKKGPLPVGNSENDGSVGFRCRSGLPKIVIERSENIAVRFLFIGAVMSVTGKNRGEYILQTIPERRT